MTLRKAADMAYPIDFKKLPKDVDAVLGYVGGDTPNIWTPLQAAQAASSRPGRVWWPIWTVPERALKTQDGWAAADGVLAALPAYAHMKSEPVFLDVEHDAWVASPVGARQCIDAWKAHMHAAGYFHAYAYVPFVAGFDWVANWTNEAPSRIPATWIGQQYGGETGDAPYDLSVFDDSLWAVPTPPVIVAAPTVGTLVISTGDDDMSPLLVTADDGKEYVVPADFADKRHIPSPEDAAALKATLAYKTVSLTAGFMGTVPDAPVSA